MASVRSGYTSSVMTDENLSDREKHDDMSDEDSDESDSDTDGSACVDDIIKCKCGDLEEQGFMIQARFHLLISLTFLLHYYETFYFVYRTGRF